MPSIIEKIENIKKLKHPNLLEYISVWFEESKNRVIVITELLQGGNLREHRKYQKKLKIKLIKKWIKQMLNALDFLHSNDYIHHDIKCQNILVDRVSGNLKLGDLFCIEKLGNREYFTKYIGTEEFMAPEVKEGKYNFKADVYSLGLTIIQLLTMEKPYREFQRKISIYEAKKSGKYPLSFNQIKNEEIKNFISLCLKDEKERPTCKELLNNKWLNNNESPDHNSSLEIINNLRQKKFILDNNFNCYINENSDLSNNNGISPLTSNNSLNNLKICKQSSMGPIYSLDISKLSNKNNSHYRFRLNSFNITKPLINESNKRIKSVFSSVNLNEDRNKEVKAIFSDRLDSKKVYKTKNQMLKHKDSRDLLKKEKNEKKDLITLYLYIIEPDYKLSMILKENHEQNDNTLFSVKLIVSNKKWKKEIISQEETTIEYEYNGEKKSMEIIIENLKKNIELTKNDILLIKNKLNGKISKVIKEKKIRDLKEKINKIIRNYEFLLNNEELDNLECIINNMNFDESKLPKEIADKVNFYKNKKNIIENLISLYNLNVSEDFNQNYNLICQEYVILNLFEVVDY